MVPMTLTCTGMPRCWAPKMYSGNVVVWPDVNAVMT